MLSLEFTFIPLKDMNPEDKIMSILDLIEKSGLDYQIGTMSSQVRGEAKRVFELLEKIDAYCSDEGIKYHIPMIFSNYCGCGK